MKFGILPLGPLWNGSQWVSKHDIKCDKFETLEEAKEAAEDMAGDALDGVLVYEVKGVYQKKASWSE